MRNTAANMTPPSSVNRLRAALGCQAGGITQLNPGAIAKAKISSQKRNQALRNALEYKYSVYIIALLPSQVEFHLDFLSMKLHNSRKADISVSQSLRNTQ
jgi:hypothetical protein